MTEARQVQAEVAERETLLEDRLERARLRRSGLPAGFLVFLVLAFLLFREDVREVAQGTASFAWMMVFGIGALLGLAFNEVTARRSIGELKKELLRLKSSGRSGSIPGRM